ncbi:MAG: imidazolonepropionase [Ignavibacteriales bacterium]|nr:imidazolonepropionase [Ignavibacteriales bacterium]
MDICITNIGQLVTVASLGASTKKREAMRDLSILQNASIVIRDGIIREIGTFDSIHPVDDIHTVDAGGRVALPGFVDSHTHTVFAGSRESEFAMRSEGRTYQEIAASGGGIASTMRATRAATKKELLHSAERRLQEMMKHGTTTVEIKSGYGLSVDAETKMLDVLRDLHEQSLTTVVPTFLGAHSFPPEFSNDHDGYIRLLIETMLPYIGERKSAVFCDVFCEQGYFDLLQTEAILAAARRRGLMLKVHADQLSSSGATELAVRLDAISADHLENISDAGIDALSRSNTIATVLPGASFFLNHPYAPAKKMIDAGVAVAIATDFNPGSTMSFSMPMMLTIACTQMKMTPEEAIAAATLNGAAALGLSDKIGSLEIGKAGDVVLYDVRDYRTIPYHYGYNHVWKVVKNGTMLEF